MKNRTTPVAALAACLAMFLMPAAGSAATPARIHYAEPVELTGLPLAGAGKPTGQLQSGFDGFGRRFDLRLESNERVLDRLKATDRRSLPAHALYKGTVAGIPGSWVRLTRLDAGIHGLVFDGRELYVLAPAAAVARELDVPLKGVAATTTVAFRAADATSGLGENFCQTVDTANGERAKSASSPAYKAIFADLQRRAAGIAAAAPTLELDLGLVGDAHFAAAYGDPMGEILARLNNVDGIFSSQVGVRIVAGSVTVLADNGPLTSLVPELLLEQFESYRRATPAIASRGLSHLVTGRDLLDTTVGVAYLGGVCATQHAASLSQTVDSTYYSSLVFAHELGHNFGAPHDGRNDSPCLSAGTSYLMAPTISGNSNFSQCSLEQMAPVVAAATCLRMLPHADVAVELPATGVNGYVGEDVHMPVDVVASGSLASEYVELNLAYPSSSGGFEFVSGTVTNGTCTATGLTLVCALGNLPTGTRRTVDVVWRTSGFITGTLTATVTSLNDTVANNNKDTVAVATSSAADGSLTLSSQTVSGYVGQSLPLQATARNAGPQPLRDATVVVTHGPLVTVTGSGTGTTCTASTFETSCVIGTLAAGETRRIDLGFVATSATRRTVTVTLLSPSDGILANNSANLTLEAAPLVELTVAAEPGPALIELGATVTQSFTLRSVGPQPVESASLLLATNMPNDVAVQLVSASGTGASCGQPTASNTLTCTYAAPIESGGSRRIDVLLRGATLGTGGVSATASAPASQSLDPERAYASVGYQVRQSVDVALKAATVYFRTYENRTTTLTLGVGSYGATAAQNARLSFPLPAGLRASGARTSHGTCTLATTGVECALGTITTGVDASVHIDVIAEAAGIFTTEARTTADGDANASNDARQVRFEVLPDIDIALSPTPASAQIRVGATIDYPVTVRTGNRPVDNAVVTFTAAGGFAVTAATPSQGSCEPASNAFRCTLGTVAGDATATIMLRLRGDVAMAGSLTIDSSGTGDGRVDNNSAQPTIQVVTVGNVSLNSVSAATTATLGSAFDLPRVTLSSQGASDDVRVELVVPTAFTVESVTAGGAPCATNAGHITCEFGSMLNGATRGIDLRLRANQAGTFAITAQVTATDDATSGDNNASISVTVNSGSNNGGNSGGSSSSGGGGGGGIDPAALLLLLVAPAISRRRRGNASPV